MKQVGGIIPYLPTPVDDKGNIIEESVSALVSHLADCGVSGICVLGSVGEFPYLLPEQKRALVNAAVKAGHASGLDVVAGVAGFSVRDLIEQSELYSSIGVDALVLMIEQYFPLSVKQLASMIIEVGNNIPDKEIILYSNPKYMHYSFPIELFENINECSNIDGYKDEIITQFNEHFKPSNPFQVYVGNGYLNILTHKNTLDLFHNEEYRYFGATIGFILVSDGMYKNRSNALDKLLNLATIEG